MIEQGYTIRFARTWPNIYIYIIIHSTLDHFQLFIKLKIGMVEMVLLNQDLVTNLHRIVF